MRPKVNVYFKLVYSSRDPIRYQVDPWWKIDDFINIMKTNIIRDFGIENFELVEAGQNIESGRLEEGVALDRHEPASLREKYGESLNVSFYIRPIYTNQNVNTTECMICFENAQTINYYTCSHPMCMNCIHNCLQNSIRSCPACRCSQVA